MNHNFRLWFELWFKLWFGVWLKPWPWVPRPRPGPGTWVPARAPKNAATNPPSRREFINDSSIFGQSFNQPQMTAAGIRMASNGVRQLKVALL